MTTEETNIEEPKTEKRQRRNTLAWIVLYLGILQIPIMIIARISSFYFKGLYITPIIGNIFGFLALGSLGILGLAFILSFIALINLPFCKTKFKSFGKILIGVLLCFFLGGIPFTDFHQKIFTSDLRSSLDLLSISSTIEEYIEEHDGYFPSINNWCAELKSYDPHIDGKFYTYNKDDPKLETIPHPSKYALNIHIKEKKISELPEDMVLLFETDLANNPVGDKSILSTNKHKNLGCFVLFANFEYKFIHTEDLDDLRWQP